MTNFSIIGTGNMAKGIEALLTRGGNKVTLISHEDMGSVALEDVVILAVPYTALPEVAQALKNDVAGKTVVDITNPVDFSSMSLTVPEAGSAAQELQSLLPEAKIVKAFNTTFAATLVSGKVGENPVTVMVAGDDEEAKKLVLDAVKADPSAQAVDAGSLSRAAQLEAFGFLQISLAASGQMPWTAGFAVVR